MVVTQCYVNSVKKSHVSFLSYRQNRLCLTFLLLSVPDFAYILFPLDTLIVYEFWSDPLQNTNPQSRTVAATTEQVRSPCLCIPYLGGGYCQAVTHCCVIFLVHVIIYIPDDCCNTPSPPYTILIQVLYIYCMYIGPTSRVGKI